MAPEKAGKLFVVAAVAALVIVALYALFIILECGLGSSSALCRWWPHFSMESLERHIRDSGPWGVALSVGLMVLHSFVPLPAEFIAIANGMVYGAFWGTLITWVGAMLGAFLAFGLARRLGRAYVRRVLKEKHALYVEDWAEKHGGGAVFVSRFIPVISFNLINYAAGLTDISWWTFAWATGLGILPITTLVVLVGDNIKHMPWYVWLLFVVLGAGLWATGHLLMKRMHRKKIG